VERDRPWADGTESRGDAKEAGAALYACVSEGRDVTLLFKRPGRNRRGAPGLRWRIPAPNNT